MAETIDAPFKSRVRAVLEGRRVTESELRQLFEEGGACVLILDGQLANNERKLAELASDSESSIADAAAAFREVNRLRHDLDELDALLVELDGWARKFRTSWLSTH